MSDTNTSHSPQPRTASNPSFLRRVLYDNNGMIFPQLIEENVTDTGTSTVEIIPSGAPIYTLGDVTIDPSPGVTLTYDSTTGTITATFEHPCLDGQTHEWALTFSIPPLVPLTVKIRKTRVPPLSPTVASG